uniref:Uncharacterized protein n=1 Tax=Entomoneis paludosa TaxID=265537 RepID=A0A7S3DNB5_9STRA|mmetsp:Transcript_22697/g.47360  ORF Transcript_22697/g.47360 Transcript_22697/m.47360 type:complete len:349 (+) Transcript_22697:130-1176(+)
MEQVTESSVLLYRVALLPSEDGIHFHVTQSGTRTVANASRHASSTRKTAQQACDMLATVASDVTRFTLPMVQESEDWIIFCDAVHASLQNIKEIGIFLGQESDGFGNHHEDNERADESVDVRNQEVNQLLYLLSRLPASWNSLALKSLWRRKNDQDFWLLQVLSQFPQLQHLELFMFRREFSLVDSIQLAKSLRNINSLQSLHLSGFKFVSHQAWMVVEKVAFLSHHHDEQHHSHLQTQQKQAPRLERLELSRCAHSTILKIVLSDELVFSLLFQQAKRMYQEELEKHLAVVPNDPPSIDTHGIIQRHCDAPKLALLAALSHVQRHTDCQYAVLRSTMDPTLWATGNH